MLPRGDSSVKLQESKRFNLSLKDSICFIALSEVLEVGQIRVRNCKWRNGVVALRTHWGVTSRLACVDHIVESNGILWNNDDIVNAMRADLSQKSKLRGVFAPTVTAFHEDGSISPKGTAAYARFLLEQGVDGLTPLGSAGEPVALNLSERKKLLEAIVDEVSGKIPIYYDPFCLDSANCMGRPLLLCADAIRRDEQ